MISTTSSMFNWTLLGGQNWPKRAGSPKSLHTWTLWDPHIHKSTYASIYTTNWLQMIYCLNHFSTQALYLQSILNHWYIFVNHSISSHTPNLALFFCFHASCHASFHALHTFHSFWFQTRRMNTCKCRALCPFSRHGGCTSHALSQRLSDNSLWCMEHLL